MHSGHTAACLSDFNQIIIIYCYCYCYCFFASLFLCYSLFSTQVSPPRTFHSYPLFIFKLSLRAACSQIPYQYAREWIKRVILIWRARHEQTANTLPYHNILLSPTTNLFVYIYESVCAPFRSQPAYHLAKKAVKTNNQMFVCARCAVFTCSLGAFNCFLLSLGAQRAFLLATTTNVFLLSNPSCFLSKLASSCQIPDSVFRLE